MFAIKHEKFEGPLDLLLGLIEERRLSINEISLAEVSNQYLEYIKSFKEFPLGEVAGFLAVASTLILIKSRSLLPFFQLSKEEEENIEDLERRLELYKKARELSQNIKNIFGKKILFAHPPFSFVQPSFLPPADLKAAALKKVLKEVIAALPPKELSLPKKIIEKVVSLEEKIGELKDRVQKSLQTSFSDFAANKSRVEVIVSFLAMLELIRQGFLLVEQKDIFGDINIFSLSKK